MDCMDIDQEWEASCFDEDYEAVSAFPALSLPTQLLFSLILLDVSVTRMCRFSVQLMVCKLEVVAVAYEVLQPVVQD